MIKKGHKFSKPRGVVQVGYKKGRLTVVSIFEPLWDEKRNQHRARVICKCQCGAEVLTFSSSISPKSNKNSCGCLDRETIRRGRLTHGLYKHPLHKVYWSMIDRCYYKKCKTYNLYGGRGVRVCSEWKNDFKKFYEWAIANGWRKGLHIDKDIKAKKLGIPALLYSPDTCSLVTAKVNNRTKMANVYVKYRGVERCISEWAELYGLGKSCLKKRIDSGMAIGKALNKPSQYKKIIYATQKQKKA